MVISASVCATLDEETILSKHAVELNKERAAMMGISGLMDLEKLDETTMAVD